MWRSGDGCENWSKYDWPEKMNRQFATYPSDAYEVAPDATELAGRGEHAGVDDDPDHHEEQRREQATGATRPERQQIDAAAGSVHSVTSSVVIRKPLRTKKVSTPRKPPTAHDWPAW